MDGYQKSHAGAYPAGNTYFINYTTVIISKERMNECCDMILHLLEFY